MLCVYLLLYHVCILIIRDCLRTGFGIQQVMGVLLVGEARRHGRNAPLEGKSSQSPEL